MEAAGARCYEIIAMPHEIRIVAIETPAQMRQAHAIRRRVFIEEQHVPEEIEMDADDAHAFHALATMDGRAVGCGRYVAHGDYVKIGRMAVLAELRTRGIGRRILEFLMQTARERGYRRAVLHAQLSAEGFYLKNEYTPVGDVFEEAGIPHRKMERPL
jgi:predicted GNAT family N-acyltransferase